jgi:hypothetical protein
MLEKRLLLNARVFKFKRGPQNQSHCECKNGHTWIGYPSSICPVCGVYPGYYQRPLGHVRVIGKRLQTIIHTQATPDEIFGLFPGDILKYNAEKMNDDNDDLSHNSDARKCACGVFYGGDFDKCTKCRGEKVITFKDLNTREAPMDRTCTHAGCEKPFTVTGPSSPRRFCDEHNIKPRKPYTKKVKSEAPLVISSVVANEDGEVLKLLVMVGAVSEKKIEQARALLRELRL